MNWSVKPPTRPGKYKMRDVEKEYTVYVELNRGKLVFRKKGETDFYSFNGTECCLWAKCR